MNWWLVSAYSAFFLILFGYVVRMSGKQKNVDRRIDALRAKLEKGHESDPPASVQ